MKGKINLSVEIDLSKVICEDGIEALQMFTGATDKEGVAVFYVQNVIRALTNVKELNLYNVSFSVSGEIINEGIEGQDLNDYALEDTVEELDELPTMQEESDNSEKEKAFSSIENLIHSCSDKYGSPIMLHVDSELYDLIFVNGENLVTRFMGVDVISEELSDCLVQLSYKPYNSNDIDFMTLAKL